MQTATSIATGAQTPASQMHMPITYRHDDVTSLPEIAVDGQTPGRGELCNSHNVGNSPRKPLFCDCRASYCSGPPGPHDCVLLNIKCSPPPAQALHSGMRQQLQTRLPVAGVFVAILRVEKAALLLEQRLLLFAERLLVRMHDGIVALHRVARCAV